MVITHLVTRRAARLFQLPVVFTAAFAKASEVPANTSATVREQAVEPCYG
jgi:hypothetical protein